MEDMPIYTVFMSFHARDDEDAENFVYSLSGKDLLDHLEREDKDED
tara:strand:- start:28 stop:165 length:138 start_codon:yes stop_codon:yes gene_type:complete